MKDSSEIFMKQTITTQKGHKKGNEGASDITVISTEYLHFNTGEMNLHSLLKSH